MHRQQLEAIRIIKNQANIHHQRKLMKLSIATPQEMKFYGLHENEFKIVILQDLNEMQAIINKQLNDTGKMIQEQNGKFNIQIFLSKSMKQVSLAAHTCNPRTEEVGTGVPGILNKPQFYMKFEANQGYVRPCLQKKNKE